MKDDARHQRSEVIIIMAMRLQQQRTEARAIQMEMVQREMVQREMVQREMVQTEGRRDEPLVTVPPNKRSVTTVTFFWNGVASLLGYFSILNSLDYFSYVYQGYDVYTIFLVPFFIGYFTVALLFRFLTSKFPYLKLIYFGIVTTNLCLVLILITSLLFRFIPGLGFGLSLLICFMMGIGGNTTQLSFFAMINYLDRSSLTKYTIGTAVGGLTLTLTRMIIVGIYGAANFSVVPIIIYYAISCSVNLGDLVLNRRFFKSEDYHSLIEPYLGKKEEEGRAPEPPYLQILKTTFRRVFPYPLLVMLNFVISLSLFPGLAVHGRFSLDFVWSSLLIILLYGLGDTIGKFLVEVNSSFNRHSNLYLLAGRLYFLWSIPLLATPASSEDPLLNNSVFPFLNILLFGLTNGFVVSASFILCFKQCPPEYRQHAGVLCGVMMQMGLMLGTIIAIPLGKIVE